MECNVKYVKITVVVLFPSFIVVAVITSSFSSPSSHIIFPITVAKRTLDCARPPAPRLHSAPSARDATLTMPSATCPSFPRAAATALARISAKSKTRLWYLFLLLADLLQGLALQNGAGLHSVSDHLAILASFVEPGWLRHRYRSKS